MVKSSGICQRQYLCQCRPLHAASKDGCREVTRKYAPFGVCPPSLADAPVTPSFISTGLRTSHENETCATFLVLLQLRQQPLDLLVQFLVAIQATSVLKMAKQTRRPEVKMQPCSSQPLRLICSAAPRTWPPRLGDSVTSRQLFSSHPQGSDAVQPRKAGIRTSGWQLASGWQLLESHSRCAEHCECPALPTCVLAASAVPELHFGRVGLGFLYFVLEDGGIIRKIEKQIEKNENFQ